MEKSNTVTLLGGILWKKSKHCNIVGGGVGGGSYGVWGVLWKKANTVTLLGGGFLWKKSKHCNIVWGGDLMGKKQTTANIVVYTHTHTHTHSLSLVYDHS